LDIVVALGLALALIMIVLGLYLLLRRGSSNQTTPPTDVDALTAALSADIAAQAHPQRPPVVPRHARSVISDYAADHERIEPVANDLAADIPDIRPSQSRDIASMDDMSDLHAMPSDDHGAANTPILTQAAFIESTPATSSTAAIQAVNQQGEDLDDILSDLDHATAKMSPPVECADLDDWQGESYLLDAHLEDRARRDEDTTLAQAETIIGLYLLPSSGRPMSGERVLHLLRQYGLRFGEMSLFHRFEEPTGQGPLMFSVLRYGVEGPSGFDLEAMPQEHIDGLAFFLGLPSEKAIHGYDMMTSISGLLARDLFANVFDEQMNPMTKQLRESYRHQVLEFKPREK
jgi:cell division protein ZipA